MRLSPQVRRQSRWLVAVLAVIAVAIVSGRWILTHERLQSPFASTYTLHAAFQATPGLTPGLGQPVNVSGVHVGTVTGRALRDGRSLVTMKIDPGKLPAVHRDARAALVPNTPLDDYEVEIDPGTPGTPVMAHGTTIPVAHTTPPPDVGLITSALDSDTREWFQALLSGLDGGTAGRAGDLRALLRGLAPTARQLDAVSRALLSRRTELRRLVHNLAVVSSVSGSGDRSLAQVVRAGGAVLQAVAKPDAQLRSAIAQLPATLQAADTSLAGVRSLAGQLGPTATALLPVAQAAPAALRATSRLGATATPVLRDDVRPLISAFQPVATNVSAALPPLSQVTPALTTAFDVLNYTVNELAYNPPGARDEGYLKWLAWFVHDVASFVSTGDAHGAVWRGMIQADCSVLEAPSVQDVLGPLLQKVGC